jgi:Fic-DOC domain mobile mystery protein B
VAYRVSLGPDPDGATPLDDDDLAQLIPDFVATRRDLNLVEFENIAESLPWARRHASSGGPAKVLEYSFVMDVHRRMFGDVWRWAGRLRKRNTNIGVEWTTIPSQLEQALGDARFWHEQNVFPPDEGAARVHHRLVSVHPFPNGNGRWARLLADLYLRSVGEPDLTWGARGQSVADGEMRTAYLAALHAADDGDFVPLVAFVRPD